MAWLGGLDGRLCGRWRAVTRQPANKQSAGTGRRHREVRDEQRQRAAQPIC